MGMTKSWNRGIVYCSEATTKMALYKFEPSTDFIKPLPLNEEVFLHFETGTVVSKEEWERFHEKDRFSVVLIDANHCPGAVIFLFTIGGKKFLHCGDFRFSPSMKCNPFLREAVEMDELYLDTTFCDPKYDFPPQVCFLCFCFISVSNRSIFSSSFFCFVLFCCYK
jgi:Cft2 family RNA processing exonuclease